MSSNLDDSLTYTQVEMPNGVSLVNVLLRIECHKCGSSMNYNNDSVEGQHRHKCTDITCRNTIWIDSVFPRYEYREITKL